MQALLTQATALFKWVFNSLLTVVSVVTNNPILLVSLLCMLVGLVIGVFKRLTNSV